MREIKDYLHLYIGCEVEYTGMANHRKLIMKWAGSLLETNAWQNIKLILRPLSDMTDEEWKKCFELSRGICDQHILDKMKKMSSMEVMFTLGKAQFMFGYHNCSGNDIRIGNGICFFLRRYLIKDDLVVSTEGLVTNESWFNDMTIEQVLNVNHIFAYLLSKHFDLFNLIESELAIDKTKQFP
jgi:hypothetical protein